LQNLTISDIKNLIPKTDESFLDQVRDN